MGGFWGLLWGFCGGRLGGFEVRGEFVGLGVNGGRGKVREYGLPVASNLTLPGGEWEHFRLG